jgi:hypothetical protein
MHISANERFWKKVLIKTENECWNWLGAKHTNGYGVFSFNGKVIRAHRFVILDNPSDIFNKQELVLHKCNNKLCCNPKHLYKGTYTDNLKQAQKEELNKGSTGKGKLLNSDVSNIRKLYSEGISRYSISKIYNINHSIINKIVINKCYKGIGL